MIEPRTPAPFDRPDLARALFEESGEALFLVDPVTITCVDANPSAARLTGCLRSDLGNLPLDQLIRHEEPTGAPRLRAALFQTGRQLQTLDGFLLRTRCETEFGDDETWAPISLNVTPLQLKRPLCLLTARDLRDQRAMLAKVRHLEAEWRHVLAAVSDALWSADVTPDGRWTYRYVSPVVEAITGRPPDYFLASSERWLELVHPDDRCILHAAWKELIGGQPAAEYEYRLVLPDGRVRWIRASVRASAGKNGRRLDGVVSDITDRRATQVALQEAEARHWDLIQHAPIAIFEEDFTAVGGWMDNLRALGVTDLRTYLADHPAEVAHAVSLIRILDANREAIQQAGATDKAELLVVLPKLFTDQARAGFAEELVALWQGRDEFEFESRASRLDGRALDLIVRLHVSRRDGKQDLRRVIVTCTDITDRRRAEEARDREHALLQAVLNAIPDRISYKDADGVYRGCNAAFAGFFGMREDEIIGQAARDLFPPSEVVALAAVDARLMAGGPAERLEIWLTAPDGRKVLFESLRAALPGPDGRPVGLIGISRDITDRRQLEDQLRQSGKLEAVGQLAGGVAHDFNNLLTAVLGNLSLAQAMLPDEHPARELLAASDTAAWRAAELTRQLLGFARRTTVRLEPANVNTSIAETLAILRRTIDPRITIDARPDSRVHHALADLGQISQVLMNLCLNARDAMPNGGTLTIETAEADLGIAHAKRVATARPGAFVRLSVADTGHGIPAEIRDRIFEPFFTTKELGKGTGLGLALVHGIVASHRGWVEVHSTMGRGTRFDVYLPRAQKPTVRAGSVSDGGQNPSLTLPARTTMVQTILLADDEPMIRTLGRTILEECGYRVLLAADGEEAVDVYRREQSSVDLVILDLAMPRMNGRDACRQLTRINPRVRVLLSSGYAQDTEDAIQESGVCGFVAKPYRPDELASAVQAVLGVGTA